jgi:hypothetical protein
MRAGINRSIPARIDTSCAPERVIFVHFSDQFANLSRSFWSTGTMSSILPGPEQAKAFAMPRDHGLWFDNDQGRAPGWPDTREPNPEHPIPSPESWPAGNRTPQDVDLVAQGNNLNLELMPRSQTENNGGDPGKKNAEHESRGYQLDPVSAMCSM